jgi:OPA family glycerol-3-phosphate transporter-like MFS transporter
MRPAAVEPLAAAHPPGFRLRRFQNWFFLGAMYAFFYWARYNLSAVNTDIGRELGWTNTSYGWITTVGTAVYGCSVFLNGPLADKVGGKRAILIGSVGAAVFNFLFGLCALLKLRSAGWNADGTVAHAAELRFGMSTSTLLATFCVLWGANHYFESFGALSIVKINAAWFHVRERGVFAGIFGAMIQGGRTLAMLVTPFILGFLPWQYCFWVPAAMLLVMFVLNLVLVENAPADVGHEYQTADETKEEEAEKPSLGFVLRKVFASPACWLIAFSSMCLGMVRNSIDHWWVRYMGTVFHKTAVELNHTAVYRLASVGMPLAAIVGGLMAGTASDKLFGSRRAPVICFAFVGQVVCLFILRASYQSIWAGALALLSVSFFIQAAHSLVGGAASMDFGGKKAVATAAGLFDGAQYLAGALVGVGMGKLLDHFRVGTSGLEYQWWPLAPLPFAIVGAILISRLWNVVPGRGGHR